MVLENYQTPPDVVKKLFLGAARSEFEHRDKGLINQVHVARPDYLIEVTPDYPAAVRPPGEDVTLAPFGTYSNGEWIFLSLSTSQIKIPGNNS